MTRALMLLALTFSAAIAQRPTTHIADFGEYADQRAMATDWEITTGDWTPRDGALLADSHAVRAFASYVAVPVASPIEVVSTITLTKRSKPDSWVTAGICVYLDSASFWQLALVEGPDGRRYAELLEMLSGTWQAQREGETKLDQGQFDGQFAGWEYDHPYQLRLRIDDREVRGEVADAASGEAVTTLAYRWGDAPGVKEGRPALSVYGLATRFTNLSATITPPSDAASPVPLQHGERGSVALLNDPSGNLDHNTIDAVATALQAGGFGVTRMTYAQLADPAALEPRRLAALVITASRAFPPAARDSLLRFLRGGGDLVLLGGPAFEEPLWPSGHSWATSAELEQIAAQSPDQVTLFDFETGGADGWARVTNNDVADSTVSIEPGAHGNCLRFDVRNLSGWDNLQATFPFPKAGDTNALSIWLKADANTPKVAIELREADGSRWIIAVDVTTDWQRYVIPDWRFGYWQDSTSEGRGEPGDYVKLPQVRSINVGQAFSHSGHLPGDHNLWFDQVGLANVDLPRVTQAESIDLPVFNRYDVYRLRQPVAAVARSDQSVLPRGTKLPLKSGGWSAIGYTFANESEYQSLLDAVDDLGRSEGSALGMTINYRGRYRDSVWLMSGIEDQSFYRSPAFLTTLTTALRLAVQAELADGLRNEMLQPVPDLALTTPPPHPGYITKSADGKHLVYPDGRRFFMIGCNYVGHFNRCGGRMWLDGYYDPRVVEQDFKMAHDAGLNVMRYWLQTTIDQDLRKGDLRKVNAIKECARRYGVYLLIDLPGTTYATEEDMLASHRAIAEAFADEPMVLGYDLRNEPYVTTLGGVRYEGEPVPVQSRDLRQDYPGLVDNDKLRSWISERPYWLHLPGWLQGAEAERVASAWTLWGQYTRENQLAGSSLPGLGSTVPTGQWGTLVDTVNASLDRWLKVQIAAIRQVDANHLITVGHNTALTILPANAQLDFVSEHTYVRPYSYDNVMENLTLLDRLATRWQDRPITFGEFGYSNGIKTVDGYLDPQTSAVGELIHYLYALSHGYDGCKKWMLCDWPLPVMKRYGDWDRGIETRTYEERFGLYYDDGTPGGHPKPIVPALRFLRDYVEQAGPGGTLDVHAADTAIGTAYLYQGPGALFVGDASYTGESLSFSAPSARNVMLRWTSDVLWIMACDDTTVRVKPGSFVTGLTPAARVQGEVRRSALGGDWLVVDLLAGEAVRMSRRP